MPKMTLWLMVEVIIFYSYIIVECLVALLIFGSMYSQHKKRLQLEIDAARKERNENNLEGGPEGALPVPESAMKAARNNQNIKMQGQL